MKLKSYDQVSEQLRKNYYAELAIEQLQEEEYFDLSWEDWAYCVKELGHFPQVVACGEEGFTVIRDGLVSRLHSRFYFRYDNDAVFLSSDKSCWYRDYLISTVPDVKNLN